MKIAREALERIVENLEYLGDDTRLAPVLRGIVERGERAVENVEDLYALMEGRG